MFRKPLCVILTICLLVGMIPAFSLSASAAVAEVSDMDTFKELMEQDGDVSIKLTDDVSKDISAAMTITVTAYPSRISSPSARARRSST